MLDDSNHRACVDEWMARSTQGLPVDRVFVAFHQAFHALWLRAHQTLGDVTMVAVVDRVLHIAGRKFSIFAEVEVTSTGLRGALQPRPDSSTSQDDASEAVRFVLVELLTVLGNLTAQILTPALHAELSRSGPGRGEHVGSDPQVGDVDRESSDDESSKQ